MTYFFGAKCTPVESLKLDDIKAHSVTRLALTIVEDALGNPIRVPIIVAKGRACEKVFGLTAAVHGNELNGIRVVQELMQHIDVKTLKGTLVACPLVNIPGYENNRRQLLEGIDLNRIMPGNARGNVAQVYAHRLSERLLSHFDFSIDLHTASFGRVNSLYVRADFDNAEAKEMARLQAPDIILNSDASDGTLRAQVSKNPASAITLEVGDPQQFQQRMIDDSIPGILRTLVRFGFLPESSHASSASREAVYCERSFWIYADRGGLLEVFPQVCDVVQKGERIAESRNVFGDVITQYVAPNDGVVIGKSTNPVCRSGSRILHLGIVA